MTTHTLKTRATLAATAMTPDITATMTPDKTTTRTTSFTVNFPSHLYHILIDFEFLFSFAPPKTLAFYFLHHFSSSVISFAVGKGEGGLYVSHSHLDRSWFAHMNDSRNANVHYHPIRFLIFLSVASLAVAV